MNVKKQILKLSRTRQLQPLWEKMFHYSRIGMNFGGGSNLEDSGEIYALKYAEKVLRNKNDLTIFDVGANVGQFAEITTEIFKGKSEIYCFEPSEKTFEVLKKNLSDKNIAAKYFNVGFGDKEEELTLHSSGNGASIASVYSLKDTYKNFDPQFDEKITITTIDKFCDLQNINLVDYLKIDIEGHEFKALLGAGNKIKNKQIKFIHFEFGKCCIYSRTYFKDFYDLLASDYEIYRIVSNGIFKIDGYSTKLENFETVNYLAELRDINE